MTKKQKKTLVRCVVSAALLAAAYLIAHFVQMPWWAKLLMFLAPYGVIGYDVILSAAKNIVHGQVFDEKFLMTIASIGAFAIGENAEGAVVMLFYQVGELFQSIAVGKSRKSIRDLMNIRPDTATVVRDGQEITVDPDEVSVGETIVVRPGEKIPLDGVVLSGTATVSTAAITGESMPVEKKEGDELVSGCIDLDGVLYVRTTADFENGTVAKILELVENASEKKAKSENFISKFARYYTPVVVVSAVLLAVIPPLFLGIGTLSVWTEWIKRALTFLVVSCPCALVISVPLSFFGGIGGASKKGILMKGAGYLEELSKVKTMIFDKTGTLTEGRFHVTAVHPHELSPDDLLDIAALAESYSSHPIAESIVLAHGGHLDKERVGKITERAGLGVEAEIDGKTVYVGNARLMKEVGAECAECDECDECVHHSGTVVHLAYKNKCLGHIMVSDVLKSEAQSTISELKKAGIEQTVMLTGDNAKTAEIIAKECGVDNFRAGLLPQQKVDEMLKLKKGSKVAFVGDGINDAPVLVGADIGIAMGAMGSDAAIEAADVVLMDDKLSKIPTAIRISKRTMRIVKENIIFALGVKLGVLILAAFGLASMWLAVFADVGVCVLAILNAMRTLK